VIASPAAIAERKDFLAAWCGTTLALAVLVLMPRAVLILLSLSVCAVRMHAQSADMSGAVREVNSCLRIVRLAASRRSHSADTLPPATDALSDRL
jgi:hypothetical protein